MSKLDTFDGHFYQPVVFYNKQIRVGFHHESLAYPLYAPVVFVEPSDATAYLSTFIKELVETKDLPEEAIVNGKINERIVKGAVQEVIMTELEKSTDGQ